MFEAIVGRGLASRVREQRLGFSVGNESLMEDRGVTAVLSGTVIGASKRKTAMFVTNRWTARRYFVLRRQRMKSSSLCAGARSMGLEVSC